MNKENFKIKNELTVFEKAEIADYITDFHFTKNAETGKDDYTPCYGDYGKIMAFIRYCCTGLEFDDNEDVYDSFTSDTDLMSKCVRYMDSYEDINNNIDKMVEFRKAQMLKDTGLEDMFVKINELIETANGKFAQIDMSTVNKNLKGLNVKNLVSSYFKTDQHDDLQNKAIKEQAEEIIKLRNEITARNVKVGE